jgi:hypothetical protein
MTTRETPEGTVRRCVDCKVEKHLETEFPKNRTCYLGYGYNCRVCNSERACAWAKGNREKVQKNQNAWRLANKEHVATKRRDWYARTAPEQRTKAKVRRQAPGVREREYWREVKRNYGLTKDQWLDLFDGQGRCCAICRCTVPGTRRRWHTDHDHATKVVRGILCHHCNNMLGRARDNIETLASGIRYLQRFL